MNDWQTIITFTQPHDAHFAKVLLESAGIETIIRDELTAQVNNFYSNAIGGVKLDVKESDSSAAIATLKEGGYINKTKQTQHQNVEIIELNENTDRSICPFCSSDNIYKKKVVNPLVLVAYLLLGAFFPIFKRNYICYDCDKEWKFRKK
ncbi:putative signal transducing protein [Carboxylicivirga sp. RSCT41]|uniref:putative signal transducing protein n=1 Tax=Carboxylicivirga agarovorans TaxID=3417570 RepID=UPI003D3562E1